jgi:lauroyl/myristoyl acyltransferase
MTAAVNAISMQRVRPPSRPMDLSRYIQRPINVMLAHLLPYSIYRVYIRLVGVAYFSTRGRERGQIVRSLALLREEQGLTPGHIALSIRTLLGIVDHYFEKMIAAHRPLPEILSLLERRISLAQACWLEEALQAGKGCLFVTGHFGSVEFLPIFLALKGYRPTMVVRFKTPRLRQVLQQKSRRIGLELLDADSANVAYPALEAMRRGRTLITLCDEFKHWRPSRDGRVNVFGRSVPQDKTLNILYRRGSAPSCLGLMHRTRQGATLSIDPLADGRAAADISRLAWSTLAGHIVRQPSQWYQWKDLAQHLGLTRIMEPQREHPRHQAIRTQDPLQPPCYP